MSFLFIDRILSSIDNQRIVGIKHVTHDDSYLSYDDCGRAYFPSALIGETLGQLAAWNIMYANNFTLRPVAGVVNKVCFTRPAYVGETLILEAIIDMVDNVAVQYQGVVTINNSVLLSLDGAIGPLLPMMDFIDVPVVQRQFQEIYRPVVNIPAYNTSVAENTINNRTFLGSTYCYDNILEMNPQSNMLAEKLVSKSAKYFADHFPNNPVLPMTILIECHLNLVKKFLLISKWQNKYRVLELQRMKMSGFIHPGDVLLSDLQIKYNDDRQLILICKTKIADKRVCIVDIILGLM